LSTTTLYRLSALGGLLSGVCIILGKLLIPLPNPQPGEIFDTLAALFGLFFTVGLYLGQRRESGVFGGVAFIVLFIGLAAVLSLDYYAAFMRLELPPGTDELLMEGPNGPVFAASGLTFLIGEVFYGISVIRAGVFSKIAAVLFIAGMIPVALHLSGIFPEIVVEISSVVAGLGLIWWSIQLYRLAGSEGECSFRRNNRRAEPA
jgi:hypothetical protein